MRMNHRLAPLLMSAAAAVLGSGAELATAAQAIDIATGPGLYMGSGIGRRGKGKGTKIDQRRAQKRRNKRNSRKQGR